MVLPTVLKRRHSLKGVKLLNAIKKIKAGQPESLKEYSRIQKDTKTESLNMEEIMKHVRELTGEDVIEMLEVSDREETLDEARWALHCLIIHANEYGQPKGQELSEQIQPPDATATTSGAGIVTSDVNNNKRKRSVVDSGDLEDRIAFLEKSAKVEKMKELKEKVRKLCLQQDPTDSLILLTVDELVKCARKMNHEDADTFEELARQANRHKKQLDISNLCLSVLGAKAADAITKTISKCMKGKQGESKSKERGTKALADAGLKPESSPLHNLYSLFMYPMPFQPPFPGNFPNNHNFRNSRPGFRHFGNRRKGACLFL